MNKIELYQREIRRMEELGRQDTPVHFLHPLTKLITTVFFLFITLSCPQTAADKLLLMFFYPLFVAAAGNIPWDFLALRVLLAAPFLVCFALSGLLLSPDMGLPHACGLLLKLILSVLSGTLLLATTGLPGLSRALFLLPLPKLLIQQILLLYRYIQVILLEAGHVAQAYSLRGGGRRVRRGVWGPMLGHLLFGTIERCVSIHQAMIGRGFSGRLSCLGGRPPGLFDAAYLFIVCGLSLLIRYYI